MIKGLTDRGARWPRIGSLRKGQARPATGNRPGADLGEKLRFSGIDDDVTADWNLAFGGELVDELPNIRLAYPTVDETWQAWNEAWVAGGLKHRCDGETVVLISKGAEYEHNPANPDGSPMKCPGGCDPAGRLEIIIPDLGRIGTVTVLTTSIHDIMNIDGCIRGLQLAWGDLRNIPLSLKRVPRMVSRYDEAAKKRVRQEKFLLHLEVSPEWAKSLAFARGAAPAELVAAEQRSLPAPNGDSHGDDDEILDGEEAVTDIGPPPEDGEGDKETTNSNGFTERIAACSTLEKLRELWPAILEIPEAAYKANVLALAWKHVVFLVKSDIDLVTIADLSILQRRLEPVPDGTPGKAEALREIQTRLDKFYATPSGAPTGPHEDLPAERRTRSGRTGREPVQPELAGAVS